jgi:hypothetical protein
MKSTIVSKRVIKETPNGSTIIEYTLTDEARQGLTVKRPGRVQVYKRTRFDMMMDVIVLATLIVVAAASVAFC